MPEHLTVDVTGPEVVPSVPSGEPPGQPARAGADPTGRAAPASDPAGAGGVGRGVLAILRRLSLAIAASVGTLAALVLVAGWGLGLPAARQLPPDRTPIRPLTAACLLLLAASVWSLTGPSRPVRRRVGAGCAAVVLAAALLGAAEHGWSVDLGTDRLLFPAAVRRAIGGGHPGRMGGDTATALGLLAAAHLALLRSTGRALLTSQAMTLAAAVLAITAVYGTAYYYSFSFQSTVAGSVPPHGLPLPAGLAVTALAVGTVAARPGAGLTRVMTSDGVGAVMGRRLLTAAVTVPFVLGWLPVLFGRHELYGTRSGIAALVAGNAVAFGVISFVAANAASRLEAVGLRTQRTARENHAELMALIDNTSAVIYLRDLAGRYRLVNRQYERLFDVRRQDILGRTDHDLFPAEIADAFRANDRAAVARGFPVQMEEIAPGEDGPHNYITVKFPLLDEAGRPYAVAGISTDITDRTRAEAEVRRLNAELEYRVLERTAELEASTKELDSFAYSVSHDLRAPLRSLDGFSQVLIEDYGDRLDDTARDYLGRLRANTVKMAQMIDDLLNLSRAARVELHRQPVDLGQLARDVVADLREAEPDRTVQVTIGTALRTTGDPHLLRLVLTNLIGNAWKFTGRTAGAAVEFDVTEQDDEQVYFVRDNGAGFNMDYAAKLFEPFQRLHSRGDFDGSGLGLAIVARVIRRHGGRIWADGALEAGAVFHFTVIPRFPSAAGPEAGA